MFLKKKRISESILAKTAFHVRCATMTGSLRAVKMVDFTRRVTPAACPDPAKKRRTEYAF